MTLVDVLALLLSIAAILAAGATWATLSMRIRELELRMGGGMGASPNVPSSRSSNGNVSESTAVSTTPAPSPAGGSSGELPPCSPRVRLLARTLGRKGEAIQVYQHENNVSEADATAAIEKLMSE